MDFFLPVSMSSVHLLDTVDAQEFEQTFVPPVASISLKRCITTAASECMPRGLGRFNSLLAKDRSQL